METLVRHTRFCQRLTFASATAFAVAVAITSIAAPSSAQPVSEADDTHPQDAGALPLPTGKVVLRIGGAIGETNAGGAAHFDRAMLSGFAEQQLTTHTSVTDGPQTFHGVLLRDVLEQVGAQGSVIEASALNDYLIDIPFSDVTDFDVILATHMNGTALTARDKGPLWIVYPRDDWAVLQDVRYDYRWVWQLTDLKIK